jgi:hypothetical protein
MKGDPDSAALIETDESQDLLPATIMQKQARILIYTRSHIEIENLAVILK